MLAKDYLIFLVFGKVCIFFLQTFPPIKKIRWNFFQELIDCDLCTGVWAFTTLCFIFRVNLVEPYFPVASELITGAFSSLLVHLVSIGYKDKFGITNILYNREE